MRLANGDKRYVYVPILDWASGQDPSGLAWQMALVPDDGREPAAGDWKTAQWLNGEVALLVGAGGAVYGPDVHLMAFVTATAGAEKPLLRAGRVTIGDPG